MVTITSHIFIDIFQTEHFSAVKFTRGNEKNMRFLLIPKSQKVRKKSEVIGLGSFKLRVVQNSRCYVYKTSHFREALFIHIIVAVVVSSQVSFPCDLLVW